MYLHHPNSPTCGVPQGSIWGSLLFSKYTEPVGVLKHGLDYMIFADDDQVYIVFHPNDL